MRQWLLAAIAILLIAAAPPHRWDEPQPQDVSLAALIANPVAFDGKRLRVIGYVNLEFEDDALYPGKEDFDAAILNNAIWIDTPAWLDSAAKRRLSRGYAVVEGTFSAGEHGHMGIFRGTLTDVRRLERWRSRREFSSGSRLSVWEAYWPWFVAATAFPLLVATAILRLLRRRPRQ